MYWQELIRQLASRLPTSGDNPEVVRVPGGNINQSYCLQLSHCRFFVKTNRADDLAMFEAEKAGLDVIKQAQAVRVPEVYATGCIGDEAFIVMEYIDLNGHLDDEQFAEALAAMHACTADRYGFQCDNTIGSTPQKNPVTTDWPDFWRHSRLDYQIALALENGLDSALVDLGKRLSEKVGDFLGDRQPLASLLHGDLWGGNYAADLSSRAVVYDPACYHGDHETDLAMMELFGHPGKRFFDCYHDHFSIDADYPRRREFYNLYHILNHANLFGGSYIAQAKRLMQKLLAQL